MAVWSPGQALRAGSRYAMIREPSLQARTSRVTPLIKTLFRGSDST